MNFDRLKDYMDRLVSEYNVPGVDCIVCKDHEEIFRYFAGVSDMASGKKTNGNELYFIFSMTKIITCTCALQLLEKGVYTLNDPVSMYLPEFEKMRIARDEYNDNNAEKIATGKMAGESGQKDSDGYAKTPITIRHLFTMGAGLDYDINSEYIKKALSEGKKTTRELIGAISKTVLGFEPGTRFRYSLCHDVLGALIEVWSGMSFGEYVKKNIVEPLGMKDTFFGLPKDEQNLSRMATRYIYGKDRKPELKTLECLYNFSDEYESGGAGLVSNTHDYSLFLDALACGGVGKTGKRILSKASIELMKTNHLNEKQLEDFSQLREGYGYGLGVRTHIDKSQSGSLSPIGEFGWDGAAGAFAMVDTENKLSLTYFQHIHGWDKRIQTEMRNILYGIVDE